MRIRAFEITHQWRAAQLAAWQDAWHSMLAETMDRVREQRTGTGKLRNSLVGSRLAAG